MRPNEQDALDAVLRRLGAEPLLTPTEVAALFRVDPKTVTRWNKAGKLACIRTVGGHRRFRESDVRALLRDHGMADVLQP